MSIDAADALSLMMLPGQGLDRARVDGLIRGLPAAERRRVRKKLAELQRALR